MTTARRFLNGHAGLVERPAALRDFPECAEVPDLREVFRVHVDYVWRMARAFGLSAEDALAAAPESEQQRFRVPRILGEEA